MICGGGGETELYHAQMTPHNSIIEKDDTYSALISTKSFPYTSNMQNHFLLFTCIPSSE